MLSFPPSSTVRIFVAREPVDMRNYAPPPIMRSGTSQGGGTSNDLRDPAPHNGVVRSAAASSTACRVP